MAASISTILERNGFQLNKYCSDVKRFELVFDHENKDWHDVIIEFNPDTQWNMVKVYWSNEKDGDVNKIFDNTSIFFCIFQAFEWLSGHCHDMGLVKKIKSIFNEIEKELRK